MQQPWRSSRELRWHTANKVEVINYHFFPAKTAQSIPCRVEARRYSSRVLKQFFRDPRRGIIESARSNYIRVIGENYGGKIHLRSTETFQVPLSENCLEKSAGKDITLDNF